MRQKSDTWIYIAIAVVVIALMVAGVVVYHEGKQSREAQAKAEEFISKLDAAGLPAPSKATVVRLFGVDGGPALQAGQNALSRAQYAWQLQTSGPATRPVVLDPRFLRAAEIYLSVYAPGKLPAFKEFVAGLKLEETQ